MPVPGLNLQSRCEQVQDTNWRALDAAYTTLQNQIALLCSQLTDIDTTVDNYNGVLSPTASLATLALILTTNLINGVVVPVTDIADLYFLDKTGSYTIDGVNTVAGFGGGTWVSRQYGRWQDLPGPSMVGNAAAALTNEAYRDTAFRMLFMRHDQNDQLNYTFEFIHSWIPTLPVVTHIHWIPMADPLVAQDVYFTGYYAWTANASTGALPALVGWTTFAATTAVSPGDVYIPKMTNLVTITPPAGMDSSCCLHFFLQRAGTNPADTYTTAKDHATPAANVAVRFVDVHFRYYKVAGSLTVP